MANPCIARVKDQGNRRRSSYRMLTTDEAISKVLGDGDSDSHDPALLQGEGTFYEYTNEDGEPIEPDGSIVVALWDFIADRETDLGFKQGDTIKVIQKFSNGWWEGEIDGRIGDFPSNFVGGEDGDAEEEEEEEDSAGDSTNSVEPQSIQKNTIKALPKAELSQSGSRIAKTVVVKKQLPVKEGFLTKRGQKRTNWKVRYFVLCDSVLSYYKGPGDFISRKKAKGSVLILRSTLIRIAPEMKRSNCFTITSGNRVIFIQAPSGEEMVSWMELLQNLFA